MIDTEPKMQIHLDPESQALIEQALRAGRYPSAEAYVNAAVRDKHLQDAGLDRYVEDHREDIIAGARRSLASGDATPFAPDWKEKMLAETRQNLRQP